LGLLGGIVGALTPLTVPATLGLVFVAFTKATAAFHWLEANARTFSNGSSVPESDVAG
jgi:hypothetical protein